MFQRVNYGTVTHEKNTGLRDLSVREWIVIAPICAMGLVMGVAPQWFLAPMEPSVRRTVASVVGSPTLNADASSGLADVTAASTAAAADADDGMAGTASTLVTAVTSGDADREDR